MSTLDMDNTSAKVVVRLKRDVDDPAEGTIGFDDDAEELTDLKVTDEGTKIHVNTTNNSNNGQVFRCSRCFSHDVTQEALFGGLELTPILDGAIATVSGTLHNACIMAYGQTGSGKTYTMFGCGGAEQSHSVVHAPADHEDDEYGDEFEAHSAPTDGIIVRSVEHLFNHLSQLQKGKGAYTIKLSSIEVCDDQVYDLFSGSTTLPVYVREHPTTGYTVHGCQYIDCTDLAVAMAAVELVARHRRGRHTSSSSHHSHAVFSDVSGSHKVDRSHNITDVWICSEPTAIGEGGMESSAAHDSQMAAEDPPAGNRGLHEASIAAQSPVANAISRLTFVDLAGSERFKSSAGSMKNCVASSKSTYKSLAVTDTDVGSINPSLYVLGRVIAGLVRTQNNIKSREVPYRESMLTKLLIQAISRSYRTHSNIIIAHIHEAKCFEAESLRTLKFVTSCANTFNAAPVKLSKQDKLIVELKMNIKRVKQENTEMRRTILNTPSWGDKVLSHLSAGELETTLAFAHADAKLKPAIKDVKKDISTTTRSEKKRGWANWNLFERNKKNKGTVLINVGAVGKTGAQVHPGGGGSTAEVSHGEFPSQQHHSHHDHHGHHDGLSAASTAGTGMSHTAQHLARAQQAVAVHYGAHYLYDSRHGPQAGGSADGHSRHGTARNSADAFDHHACLEDYHDSVASHGQWPVQMYQDGEQMSPVLARATSPFDRGMGESAALSLKIAEAQKSEQMRAFVRAQCKRKGMTSLISPYVGKLHDTCVISLCGHVGV